MAVPLYFRKSGKGPDLVILHGLFGSSDNWLPIAKKLESHFTIYIPDLRNHGQSPHSSSHTYREMTGDLELFFTTHGITKATILGHSMGGKTAMMFAAEFQEKTDRLIVADISPRSYNQPVENGEDNELLLDVMENLNLGSVSTRKEIDEYLSRKISSITLRQFILKNIRRDHLNNFLWKINVPVLKANLPHILSDVSKDYFMKFMPLVKYPVTFIRGQNSGYIQDSDIPLIREIYPLANIINIPGAGHWLHAEQPEEFTRAVLSSTM